jgi:hypothetical protein
LQLTDNGLCNENSLQFDAPLLNEKDIPDKHEDCHDHDEYSGKPFKFPQCSVCSVGHEQDQIDLEGAASNLFCHLKSYTVEKTLEFAVSNP